MDKRIIYLNVQDVEKRRHPSKHYVYVINVTWQDDSTTIVYRRYNQFFELQSKILEKFPEEAGLKNPADRIIPFLPGKIFFGRSSILNVALKRLPHIDRYCKDLLQLPSHIPQCDDMMRFFESTSEDLLPEKQPEEEISARVISEPELPEKYCVTLSYETEKLNLGAGSIVEVLEKTDSGWWCVRTDASQGWVPASYLQSLTGGAVSQRIHTEPTGGWKYVCTRSYKPQQPDEVAINKGGLVRVLEKNVDGWWLVRYNNQTGRAPGTYMTRTGTLKANRLKGVLDGLSAALLPKLGASSTGDDENNWTRKPHSVNWYCAVADFTSETTDGIDLRQDDIVKVLTKDSSGWWLVECGNRQGWAPSTYLQATSTISSAQAAHNNNNTNSCGDEDFDEDDFEDYFDDDDFDDDFDDEFESDDLVDGPPQQHKIHPVPPQKPTVNRFRPTPPPKPSKPSVPPKPTARLSMINSKPKTPASTAAETTQQTNLLFHELQRKFER